MTDMNQNPMNDFDNKPKRDFTEELEVTGNQLVDRVKEFIEQGNVRRLIIRNPERRILLEIPLTVGVVAGGALFAFYPIIAAVGALAALVARVSIEIQREEPDAIVQDVKEGIRDVGDAVEDVVDDARDNLSGN